MKNINKLFYFFNIKNYIYPIILIYVAKVYIDHNFFNYRITSDTAGTYNYFQYYYNFFLKYKSFPEWIDYMDGGFPSILPMQNIRKITKQ